MDNSYHLASIASIAQICAQQGVCHAVLSPGSRCAPLTLSFVRHPDIATKTVSDERSAAFIALGMAQQLKSPVVLICTSGSAGLNYAPAVVEAFYQQVPLIVITADRPPEWLNQQEGQTIHQQGLYGLHSKQSFQLPTDYQHANAQWQMRRMVSEAINAAKSFPLGPVHINAPLREPLYPTENQVLTTEERVATIDEITSTQKLPKATWEQLLALWHSADKKLVVCGQQEKNKKLTKYLASLDIPIIGDIIANQHEMKSLIRHQDVFLGTREEGVKETLQPELLISFGKSVVSKNLKTFLRKHPPKIHWHIQESGGVADTFQSLTNIIRTSPTYFFKKLSKQAGEHSPEGIAYRQQWQDIDKQTKVHTAKFIKSHSFSELEAVKLLLDQLPSGACLHLANSLSVRYANYLHLYKKKQVEVFSNRGTAGIDGCTSTMLGHSMEDDRLHILLTGDVAFFYDRNAFWNNYWKNNFRVLLLNNHGGSIFRMIPASKEPELEEYFETKQPLTATSLATEFGLEYQQARKRRKFKRALQRFLKPSEQSQLLELITNSQVNQAILKSYKQSFSPKI